MGKRFWILTMVGVLVLGAAAGGGGYLLLQRRDKAAQKTAAESFAHAWQTGGLATISYASGEAVTIAKETQAATARVTSASQDRPSKVVVGSVSPDGRGDGVTATLAVTWTLTGGRIWNYTSQLPLSKVSGRWLPTWQPSVLHPELTDGELLQTVTQDADRGRILGAKKQVLVSERPVVVVGIQPSRADDLAATVQEVARMVGIGDTADLLKRVKAANEDAFVPVITLREAAYQQIRDQLRPIPGTVFQERTLALAPTSTFARALLGSVGPATAEIVKASDNRVQADQTTGLSGVQRAFDKQLSGAPGLTVQLVPKAGTTSTGTDSTTDSTTGSTTDSPDFTAKTVELFSVAPENGKDLQLTIDRATQVAAEKALQAAKHPAALVAIKASTGEILAVANGGPNAAGYNRALIGRYPPGSTFKVVSGLSLLEHGLTANTPVRCPAKITVSGRQFSNAEDEVLGSVSFRSDFAHSCNTAFIGSARRITSAQLAATASSLGFGRKNQVGVETFTGSVPTSTEPVAHAASMIGQGEVLASPLTVAGASAAVAAGKWIAPHLVAEADVATTALPAAKVAVLRSLMRSVVTGGTATVMRNTPGGEVHGKTGTAEFGNDKPPKTHAWFTGYQGDLAFAVIVEDGGFGAETAAPIAKSFLTDLA